MAKIGIKRIKVLGKSNRLWWNSRRVPKDAWGDYDPEAHVIRIAKAPALQQREALLHEISHAIEREYGFDLNHDKLTLLVRGLLMVMRENDGLADLIFGKE